MSTNSSSKYQSTETTEARKPINNGKSKNFDYLKNKKFFDNTTSQKKRKFSIMSLDQKTTINIKDLDNLKQNFFNKNSSNSMNLSNKFSIGPQKKTPENEQKKDLKNTILSNAFDGYLKGKYDLKQLILAKNSPKQFYLAFLQNNELFQEEKTNKKKLLNERETEARKKVLGNFKKISDVINDRINFKKSVKCELDKINPYYIISSKDPRFIQNFFNISNIYLDKIKNKDLINSDTQKKYYLSYNRRKKVQLKEMEIKKEVAKEEIKREINEKIRTKKTLYYSFFKMMTDQYLNEKKFEESGGINKLSLKKLGKTVIFFF
jgi:hypothetical protein